MQASLISRLLSAFPSLPALLGASKAAQPVRRADEFPMGRLRRPPVPPATWTVAPGWPLEEIYAARAEQLAGRFRRPVELAVAMRTHGDLYAAWRQRVAPLGALGVEIVPAKRQRGAAVAREAEVLFGQPGPNRGVGCSVATVKAIIGTMANHGGAIGYNTWTPRPDGSRDDVEHKPWPLEHVWYDASDDQLYTSVDPSMTAEERAALMAPVPGAAARHRERTGDMWRVPINHADGRWTVYRLSAGQWWRELGALPSACLTWAAAAFSDRDMNRSSTSHGNAKTLGYLPDDTPIQQPVLGEDGQPTGEVKLSDHAQAMINLLEDLVSLDEPYGIAPKGSEVKILSNPSNMWQVWKELGIRAERLAYLIYTGTTAGLGVQSEGPGVNVEQLMDVGMPIVQDDKAAFEIGFHEGVMVPWTAVNFGDSSLAPQRLYQLPDVDAQQHREHAVANEKAFVEAYEARKAAGILTQEWADQYADRLGVPRVVAPADAPPPTGFTLAPTDVARVIDANEARASIGLSPKPDGNVPLVQYGVPTDEEPASGVRPAA